MGSSRFPGKVLADVNGMPAIERLVRRLRQARHLDDIVIATTTNPKDDALVSWAQDFGVSVHRGSEGDVLQRVVDAQKSMNADIVVEITGDATLSDPGVVDRAIERFNRQDCDIVSTSARRSYPLGIDAQVFRLADLAWVADNVHDLPVREHVSLHFYENPGKYRIVHLDAPEDERRPQYRLVLDYREDLQVLAAICRHLEPVTGEYFSTRQIVEFLDASPDVVALNADCFVKPVR